MPSPAMMPPRFGPEVRPVGPMMQRENNFFRNFMNGGQNMMMQSPNQMPPYSGYHPGMPPPMYP